MKANIATVIDIREHRPLRTNPDVTPPDLEPVPNGFGFCVEVSLEDGRIAYLTGTGPCPVNRKGLNIRWRHKR